MFQFFRPKNCIALFLIFSIVSCDNRNQQESSTKESKVVATVGSRKLLQSDLDQIIHPSTTQQDSVALASMYIDQWVRDQLMTREAAKYFSSDFEIEKLVDDYREKLLKFNLEERVVAMRFDTIITEIELNEFYLEMKDQFILDQTLYRCIFAEFEKGTAGLSGFIKDWNAGNDLNVFSFAAAFSNQSHLDTAQWVSIEVLDDWNNKWSTRKLSDGQIQRQNDKESEFFLKIVEKVDKGQPSPLDYIKDRLVHMLLHRRKQNILEKYKQDLYEDALERNIITLPS